MAKSDAKEPNCPMQGKACEGSDCALWIAEKNDDYSGCAVARLAWTLKQVMFRLPEQDREGKR